MINETVAAAVGVAQGTMVSYIISFLFSAGVVYLAITGAIKLWDTLYWSYQSVKTDMMVAKEENISVFSLWKAKVNAKRPSVDRLG